MPDPRQGRPLLWSQTGGTADLASRRLRLVKRLLVGWPLLALGLIVAGCAAHMS